MTRAILQGQISRGNSIHEFEGGFAALLGGGEAASVVTGTAAIEVVVRALGLSGEEVVSGAMSCQATANALLAARCSIRFADHDPHTWQVSADSVARAITPRTRALVIAHLYGHTADVPAIARLARSHSIHLIEDCSQCLGARWNGRPAGTFGTASTFSFYGNKLITTGQGGMIWTADSSLAKQVRLLRDYGQDRPFHHVVFGLNWKLPNVLAALGVEQLKRVPKLLAARRKRMLVLRRMLAGDPQIQLPDLPQELEPAPFCFPVVLRSGNAADVQKRLADLGIETRPLFVPQFDQPCWKDVAPPVVGQFTAARHLAKHGFYISVSPHLKLRDCAVMATELLNILREQQRSTNTPMEAHAA